MSVESETAGAQVAAPAVPPANPNPLALITFLPSGITLGLWLVGYLPTTALPGGMIPILLFSAGLFMMISTIWAAREHANAVAAVFGVFSAFWISFGALVFFLNNSLIINAAGATPAEQTLTTAQSTQIQATFVLSFTIVFIALTLATLRLPLVFTVGFVFVDITFVLVFLALGVGATGLLPIAGITTFIFCAVFAYILVSDVGAELGGRPLGMGSPIQK